MSASLTYAPEADDATRPASAGPAYPGDLDARHTRLIEWFEEAERSSMDERALSERDRDYVDCDQWTTAERNELRRRNQPAIQINYCRRKVDLLRGLERKARTDPKAFPRTPTEEDRADAATQVLRYITEDTDFQVTRSAVFDNVLVEGYGGVEMSLADDGAGGADVTIMPVPWDRIWKDPHSRALDFSDARYLGTVIWMDRDQLLEMYPGADDVVEDSFDPQYSDTYGDRPGKIAWSDNNRVRVRVVQCHWSERGIWWDATFTRAGFLVEPMTHSWCRDKRGRSDCRLTLLSGYIDRQNRRYGMVRDLISIQDEINKRRSKALHLLSVSQVIAEEGAVRDVDATRREVARPDGYIQVAPGMRFDIEHGADLATGQFELLKHATEEMQLSGPNASMSGTDSKELSGRAILAQQAGGAVQNEPLADALRMWSRRVYEKAWMAARAVWTAGKWVRVTDDLGSTRWVGINQKVTLADELANMPDQQRAMVMQRMGIVPGDPRLQQVIRTENDITHLDVDIAVEEGMDIPSMQAETFQSLVQIASIQPGLIPGDVLIAASSLRNKADLLARMKAHQEQQQQQAQQAEPLMRAGAEAKVADLQGKAAANHALAVERMHNVHQGYVDMRTPTDPPSLMPPEIQAEHDAAALRGMHAKAAVDEARAVDLAHQAAGRIAATHQMHHAMHNPQPAAQPNN
jgi:hypothetical protein